ncbi:orotidine-5'-phosphate decarboxylase [Roseivivax isoporae]|uniref:Orotidine-5'-phosphate decarboxylase n=1 Tax=Roseivivax isoporae LMG 25204 TaxID=1449351 RepID=X7F9H1_9RHOB|nr:orotidine-5'-phosphate decarboxylase [Roseivivax isoporae]ETX29373.1 hypothetical protein RISW2_01500 [Roseivivax isoporae LMG 25204]
MTTGFRDTVLASATDRPSFCVGIDPSTALLQAWGLPDDAGGALDFARALLAASEGLVPVVKPQVAYFERFGADGFAALTRVLAEARDRGLKVIADAKRGDIGTSCEAYAAAWFGPRAPMRADALTVAPYLGVGSLVPVFEAAAADGAYVFVVARSSNPEGERLQQAGAGPVWRDVLDAIAEWEAGAGTPRTVGAVVGATAPGDLRQAVAALPEALFLAPGIGAQGASAGDLAAEGLSTPNILLSSSRAIARLGPDRGALRAGIEEALAGL